MKLDVIKKDCFGALPLYRSYLENPILFVWDGEKAVHRPSHKQVVGIECDFEEEIAMPFEKLAKKIPIDLDKAYSDARDRLDAKINHVIQTLAKAADEAKVVLSGQENHVRIVQYTKLETTFFASHNVCILHEVHAFTAEVY